MFLIFFHYIQLIKKFKKTGEVDIFLIKFYIINFTIKQLTFML